jgi:hemoglobin-like flavoprotein
VKELSLDTIRTVKATALVLVQHGLAITTRMYERLFVDAEIKALFDQAAQASGEQPRRLAAAIVAFAQNVDNLPALASAIERMAEKHVRSHVKAEHYPAVANALLPAIRDVLGEAATAEVLTAWGEAYGFLADVLIARERELYRATETETEAA